MSLDCLRCILTYFNFVRETLLLASDNKTHTLLNFEYRGVTRLRDTLGYARKYNKKPKWLPPSVWNEMLKHWSKDDKFKKLSQQNKKK